MLKVEASALCSQINAFVFIRRKRCDYQCKSHLYLFVNKAASSHVVTVAVMRVFERRIAGQKTECIRKVLRRANSIKFLSTWYPNSIQNSTHVALITRTSKFAPKCSPANFIKTVMK
jgi:hypothetical protein